MTNILTQSNSLQENISDSNTSKLTKIAEVADPVNLSNTVHSAVSTVISDEKPAKVSKYRQIDMFCEAYRAFMSRPENVELAGLRNKGRLLFRGFPVEMYENLKIEGIYPSLSGAMGKKAVWMSNSLGEALTYQNEGVIAVIPYDKVKWVSPNGPMYPGTAEYRAECDKRIAQGMSVWDVDDELDLVLGEYGNIFAPCLPQPIDITSVFLVWRDGKVVEEYPVASK